MVPFESALTFRALHLDGPIAPRYPCQQNMHPLHSSRELKTIHRTRCRGQTRLLKRKLLRGIVARRCHHRPSPIVHLHSYPRKIHSRETCLSLEEGGQRRIYKTNRLQAPRGHVRNLALEVSAGSKDTFGNRKYGKQHHIHHREPNILRFHSCRMLCTDCLLRS
jgi:hypothetical protein